MKIEYDPKHDIMNIEFLNKGIDESVEVEEGIIIDYSKEREIVSIELLDVSKRTSLDPMEIVNLTVLKGKEIPMPA